VSNEPLILIVDDELSIRRLLRAALERASFRVRDACSGSDALAIATAEDPRVILLDLGLPDRDGLELIPVLRKQSRAAILIVSARDATEEKVSALDLGAVDYVTKPFDTEELLARVRAAIRHRIEDDGGQTAVKAGSLTIDLLAHTVTKNEREVHLTPKEFAALAELARFPGRVITHQQLLRTIWPNEYERHIEYLRVLIRNVRQKIEDDPSRPTSLVNELGVGYRLKAATG
jgi:two-component system, OmpR family, KDP operon response regulator KdpE